MRTLGIGFLLSVSVIMITGCLKMKKKGEVRENAPIPTNQSAGSVIESNSYQLVSTEEPNQFLVRWNVNSKVKMIKRTEKDSHAEIVLFPQHQGVEDSTVIPDKTYIYELGYAKDSGFVALESQELRVPLDFVVEGNLQVPTTLASYVIEADRVFFKKGASITTNGIPFYIRSRLVSFMGGNLIQTFPPGQKSGLSAFGRSGGTVVIRADESRGELRVEMRGENGGDGRSAGPRVDRPQEPRSRECVATQGYTGYGGEPGTRGGDSGELHFQIMDMKNLKLSYIHEPGSPGLGGFGGPGSPGSPSYVPSGSIMTCPEGSQGLTGPQAAKGESGLKGMTCFSTSTQKSCD